MKSCNDVMTKDPTCCLPGDTLVSAAQIMKNEDVGSIPVVESQESKKLVGIVTDRDIVIKAVAEGKDYMTATIGDVMTGNPITCRPDDRLQTAMDRMAEHQVRRIPVIDGKENVVGIIAQADLATRIDKPKRMAEVLEDISQPA